MRFLKLFGLVCFPPRRICSSVASPSCSEIFVLLGFVPKLLSCDQSFRFAAFPVGGSGESNGAQLPEWPILSETRCYATSDDGPLSWGDTRP
jgi:hypothetical protein